MNDATQETRTDSRDMLVAVLAAFTIRLLFLIVTRRAIDMPDAIHYIAMARQFAGGDFVSFDENLPLLYSAFGAIAHLIFDDWERAFWLVSLVCSSLLVVPVYALAQELFDRDSARISAVLVCLWPWLVDYGSRITPDALAVTLWFASLWFLYRAVERGGLHLALAPTTLFLLHLSRPEGTFLMLAAPIGGLTLAYGRGATHYKRLGVVAGACIGLLVCYAIAMRFAIGTLTLSYRAPMAGDLSDYFRRGAADLVRTFLRLSFTELPVMIGPVLLAFLGVGLFRRGKTPRKFRLEFLILFFCAVQYALALANLSPAPRYIMSIVVALSLWSAYGIDIVAKQAAEMRRGNILRRLPICAVVAMMALGHTATIAPEYAGFIPRTPREYRLAGQWMKENLEPGLVISRKSQLGFYADMPSIGPDLGDTPETVAAFAKGIGARYLVMDERYSASMIPGLRPLLDPAQAPPDFKLLKDDVSPYDGAAVVIYEIVTPGIKYRAPEDFTATRSHRGPDERRRKVER